MIFLRNSLYLRALLRKNNIKTIELSRKMGIAQPTLNRKIQGITKFTENDIRILLESLNMTYEEVFNTNLSVINLDDKTFIIDEDTTEKIIEILNKRGDLVG